MKHISLNCNITYLAIAKKASSTLRPLLADVSMKVTLYSLASLSPSSFLTTLSEPQSHLFPTIHYILKSRIV